MASVTTDTKTDTVTIEVSREEWADHMRRVRVITALLGGLMNALSANPMFAAFIPAELQQEIAALNE